MNKSILVVILITTVIIGYGIFVGSTAQVKDPVPEFYRNYQLHLENGKYDQDWIKNSFSSLCKEYLLGKRSRQSKEFQTFQDFCKAQVEGDTILKEIVLEYRDKGLKI